MPIARAMETIITLANPMKKILHSGMFTLVQTPYSIYYSHSGVIGTYRLGNKKKMTPRRVSGHGLIYTYIGIIGIDLTKRERMSKACDIRCFLGRDMSSIGKQDFFSGTHLVIQMWIFHKCLSFLLWTIIRIIGTYILSIHILIQEGVTGNLYNTSSNP